MNRDRAFAHLGEIRRRHAADRRGRAGVRTRAQLHVRRSTGQIARRVDAFAIEVILRERRDCERRFHQVRFALRSSDDDFFEPRRFIRGQDGRTDECRRQRGETRQRSDGMARLECAHCCAPACLDVLRDGHGRPALAQTIVLVQTSVNNYI
jgi:hypothetical protein